ncbi:MAG: hypothetical protein JWO33_765 [Caulobacteraceae bacterium]|nr:hypothetical protein [Caulobacteraceae bacterium]
MATPEDIRQRHDRILAELAAINLAAARDLQGRMAQADDMTAAALSLALQRTSRSIRQTLALEAKLARDRTLALRDDEKFEARKTDERLTIRKARLQSAVERLIWTEADGDEVHSLIFDLENHLDEAILDDAFEATPLETHIQRLCEALGLNPPLSREGDREAVEGVTPPPWPNST